MENIILPQDLNTAIGAENQDFAVKAKRAKPFKDSIFLFIFGIIWTSFSILMAFLMVGPILQGKETHFTSGGVDMVAGPGNLGPIILPGIMIGIFVLVGIGILGFGISALLKEGGYFVGLPTRLLNYQKDNLRSIDWEQFSGDIEVKGSAQKGTIKLQMRTGEMVSRKNGPSRYVPDNIYICGAPNVFEIEQICRKRIKENDPTPPVPTNNNV